MRHVTWVILMGMLVGLSMRAPNAVSQEKDKPVLEQLLDLLLQRGQIDREQYNTLQEKARKEQSSGVQVGFERGRPFIGSADGNVRFDMGGRFQLDPRAFAVPARPARACETVPPSGALRMPFSIRKTLRAGNPSSS